MKRIIYVGVSLLPTLALAQTVGATETALGALFTSIKNVLNMLVPVLIALAVIYFFWGLVNFVRAAGDEKAREAGKSQMLWGIIAIAIMVSVFGLVAWLQNALGVQNQAITPPSVNIPAA